MRYFIHVATAAETILDIEGAEFHDLQAAEVEAAQGARELIAEELRSGRPVPMEWRVQVAGEDGTVVTSIPFATLVFAGRRSASGSAVSDRDSLPAVYAHAKATSQRSRAINDEIQATVCDIRDQLRALAVFTPSMGSQPEPLPR
jgi:hypothetical protein